MRSKNEIITLTRSELNAMIENAVTERLLQLNIKYPDLFEDYDFSSEDEDDEDEKKINRRNIVRKLNNLIKVFEEDYENEEDKDYGISYDIRHYRRGDKEFRSFEGKLKLYNDLKKRIMEEV